MLTDIDFPKWFKMQNVAKEEISTTSELKFRIELNPILFQIIILQR